MKLCSKLQNNLISFYNFPKIHTDDKKHDTFLTRSFTFYPYRTVISENRLSQVIKLPLYLALCTNAALENNNLERVGRYYEGSPGGGEGYKTAVNSHLTGPGSDTLMGGGGGSPSALLKHPYKHRPLSYISRIHRTWPLHDLCTNVSSF